MSHINITNENFKEEIENYAGKVILDFYAVWCGPCKMLSPILDAVAEDHPEWKLCKCDVDNAMELAAKFGIQSIPAVFFFENGKVKHSFIGYCEKEEIEKILEVLA